MSHCWSPGLRRMLRVELPNVPAAGLRERRRVEDEVVVAAAPAENLPLALASMSPTRSTGWPLPPSPTPGDVVGAGDRERRAGAQEASRRRSASRPARSCISVFGVAPERQVVDVVDDSTCRRSKLDGAPVVGVVVGVPQHVALVAGVVLGLAERVGDADLQAVAVAAVGAELQAVVDRAARVLGDADRAVAHVGTQRRDVARPGSPGSCPACSWLMLRSRCR